MLLTVVAARTHALRPAGALVAQTGGYTRAFAVASVLMVGAAAISLLVLPSLKVPKPAPTLVEAGGAEEVLVAEEG